MQLSESSCYTMQFFVLANHVAQLCITHILQVSQLQRKLFAHTQAQDLQLVQVRTLLLAITHFRIGLRCITSPWLWHVCAASGLQQRDGAYGTAFGRSCGEMP